MSVYVVVSENIDKPGCKIVGVYQEVMAVIRKVNEVLLSIPKNASVACYYKVEELE